MKGKNPFEIGDFLSDKRYWLIDQLFNKELFCQNLRHPNNNIFISFVFKTLQFADQF